MLYESIKKLVQYGIPVLLPNANVFTQQIFFLNSFMKTTTKTSNVLPTTVILRKFSKIFLTRP